MSLSPTFSPFTVILCQLCPPQQTGAVKTLPLHTPISLVLSFFPFLPVNSQFDLFVLTKFLFQFQQYIFDLHAIFQFMFLFFLLSFQFVYFQQTPPPYQQPVLTHRKHHRLFRSWHNATTKFNCHNIHNIF